MDRRPLLRSFGVAAVLAVLLGAFAAHFLLADRGYVLVNFRELVVEMSVPGLVIVLVVAYLTNIYESSSSRKLRQCFPRSVRSHQAALLRKPLED